MYCHVHDCDYRRISCLKIGFTDHFNSRLLTAFNYGAIADLHTLQITTAHAKLFSRLCLQQSFPGNDF
jgi:hypothetical protein